MMKKILLPLIFSFSFSALAITPEQLCADFRTGNQSIIATKFKGKEITYTGKVEISYTDKLNYRFVSFFIRGDNLTLSASKDLKADEDAEPYFNMDGKTKTITVTLSKNNPIELLGFDRECFMTGRLISIN